MAASERMFRQGSERAKEFYFNLLKEAERWPGLTTGEIAAVLATQRNPEAKLHELQRLLSGESDCRESHNRSRSPVTHTRSDRYDRYGGELRQPQRFQSEESDRHKRHRSRSPVRHTERYDRYDSPVRSTRSERFGASSSSSHYLGPWVQVGRVDKSHAVFTKPPNMPVTRRQP